MIPTPFFAVRQRGYAKLLQQIFVQNIWVFIQFQSMLKELEKRKPFIAPSLIDRVPKTLEYADPENGNARFFDFQVEGILQTHVKEGLPSQQYGVLEFLCGVKFLPVCSIGNGVSWLELYALFLVHNKQANATTDISQSRSEPC